METNKFTIYLNIDSFMNALCVFELIVGSSMQIMLANKCYSFSCGRLHHYRLRVKLRLTVNE